MVGGGVVVADLGLGRSASFIGRTLQPELGDDLDMIVDVAPLCCVTPGEFISRVVVVICRGLMFVADMAAVRVDLH